jgi:hypothetical protein
MRLASTTIQLVTCPPNKKLCNDCVYMDLDPDVLCCDLYVPGDRALQSKQSNHVILLSSVPRTKVVHVSALGFLSFPGGWLSSQLGCGLDAGRFVTISLFNVIKSLVNTASPTQNPAILLVYGAGLSICRSA